MKKTILFLSLFAVLAGQSLEAKQIDEREAMAMASQFGTHSARLRAKSASSALTLAHTAQADGVRHYYVFNRSNGNGYIIVAADDCAQSILGYSDRGSFSYDRVPDNMRWWLGEYARQIDYAIHSESVATEHQAPERPAIEPLVKAKWDQDGPYNLCCPKKDEKLTVTGCAATAVAQIMRVHNWPAEGKGNHNLGHRYDWDSMLYEYGPGIESTAEQDTAVAVLMHDVGVGIKMVYDVAENGGSGAYSFDVGQSLVDHFGYDASVQFVMRDFYTDDEWNTMIYDELAQGRPVYYSGVANMGTYYAGHAFVCDGYDGNEMFHINWGWSGEANDYFRLSALRPAIQGIGGAGGDGAFNLQQQAVIGIKPDEGGVMQPSVVCNGDFTVASATNVARGAAGNTVRFDNGTLNNVSIYKRTVTLGVKFTAADGTEAYAPSTTKHLVMGVADDVKEPITVAATDLPDIPEGDYVAAPAFFDEELQKWCEVKVTTAAQKGVAVKVVNSAGYKFFCFSSTELPEISAVESIAEQATALSVEVFTTSGVLVHSGDAVPQSLPSGIYIVRHHYANGVTTEKIVR